MYSSSVKLMPVSPMLDDAPPIMPTPMIVPTIEVDLAMVSDDALSAKANQAGKALYSFQGRKEDNEVSVVADDELVIVEVIFCAQAFLSDFLGWGGWFVRTKSRSRVHTLSRSCVPDKWV